MALSTEDKIAIGVATGLGVVGVVSIVYALVKADPKWEYQVIPTGAAVYMVHVWDPEGAGPRVVASGIPNYGAAQAVAISYIKAQGGIPVARGSA